MVTPLSFPQHSISYLVPTWQELDDVCVELATRISESGLEFDRLITLAKGGWPMTRSLVDLLAIPEVASIGIRFYAGINERMPKPEIYQDLPVAVQGERVLLFDDVADSGESLAFTRQHLLDLGVSQVTLATLYYKPRSVIKPDYYGAETSSWIVFPFEIMESVHQIFPSLSSDTSPDSLKEMAATFGITTKMAQYYIEQYLPKVSARLPAL